MARRKRKNILKQWKKKFKSWKKGLRSSIIHSEARKWGWGDIVFSLVSMTVSAGFLIWYSISFWSWYCIWDILLAVLIIVWGFMSILANTADNKRIYYHHSFGGGRYSDRDTKTDASGCFGCALFIPLVGTIINDLSFIIRGNDPSNLFVVILSLLLFIFSYLFYKE